MFLTPSARPTRTCHGGWLSPRATGPDGRVSIGGALWGRHDLSERFARFVAKRLPPPSSAPSAGAPQYRVMVGHGDAPEQAQALARHLEASLPGNALERSYLTDMGTALGVHGGPGTLIVGVQRL